MAKNPPTASQQLASGATYYFLGYSGKLAGPLFLFLASRYYPIAELGYFFGAWAIIQIAQKIAVGGICEALVIILPRPEYSENPKREKSAFTTAFIATGVISITFSAIIFILPEIASYFNRGFSQGLNSAIRVMALSIPFLNLSQLFITYQRAGLNVKSDVYINSIAKEVLPLAGISLLIFFPSIPLRLAIIQTISSILMFAFALNLFGLKKLKGLLTLSKPDTVYLKTVLPYSLNDVMLFLVQELDLLMLTAYKVPPLVLAVYGISTRLAFTGRMIRLSYQKMFLPLAAGLVANNKKNELISGYQSLIRWVSFLVLPFYGIIWMAPGMILSIFSPEYAEFGQMLTILTLGPFINSLFGANMAVLMAARNGGLVLLNYFFATLFNFSLNLILIPKYGAIGAAIATTVSMSIVQILVALQISGYVSPLKTLFALFIPLRSFLIAYLPPVILMQIFDLSKFVFILIFSITYIVIVWKTGLSADDQQVFANLGVVKKLKSSTTVLNFHKSWIK